MGMNAPSLLRTTSTGSSDAYGSRPTTSSSTGSTPSPRGGNANNATTNNNNDGFEKLVFPGLSTSGDDGDDSNDANVVLLHTVQQAARDISSFVTSRPISLTPSAPGGVITTVAFTATETDDCQRLLRRVHERLEVLSQSLLNLPIATGSSLGVDVSRNIARSVRYAIEPLPSNDTNVINGDDDDLRPMTSMGVRAPTPSSAGSSRPLTSSASTTSTPSSQGLTLSKTDSKDGSSQQQRDARYWEERYLALRVKALKMNNAGMRLKAISEQNQSVSASVTYVTLIVGLMIPLMANSDMIKNCCVVIKPLVIYNKHCVLFNQLPQYQHRHHHTLLLLIQLYPFLLHLFLHHRHHRMQQQQ
jgi:hypothetical protein